MAYFPFPGASLPNFTPNFDYAPRYPTTTPTAYQPQPLGLGFLTQMLAQLMQSVSLLANNWTQLLQPQVQLPRPHVYTPPNTDFGWPKLQGFQGSPRVDSPPPGYEWNKELMPRGPGVGNSSEPYRYFLSPKGAPGLEMRQVAPGQYLPVLGSKYPPLPPNIKTSYAMNEKPPAPPPGYQWAGRWPGSHVLAPKGMPEVDLQYTEFGWTALKHHDNPYA